MTGLTKRLGLIISVLVLFAPSAWMQAQADEIRPALLDIKEQNTGLYSVTWKVPTRGERVLAITPRLPESLELLGSTTVRTLPGALLENGTYKNNGDSLTGQTIAIEGLSALQTDVLLLIQLQDGTQHSAILRPASPSFTIPLQASKLKIAGDYWRMGIVHILEGVDHLLFVLALMLIVSGFGPLLKAVTAFTVAHSITLALATLGVVHLPAAPTEAVISLSILFLAAEIIREKIYQLLQRELPYATAVTVERIQEISNKNLISITATLHVESESQKGILIGKGGHMIKAVGRKSRLDLERLFGVPVFLDLMVRVEKKWSRNPKALLRLGY